MPVVLTAIEALADPAFNLDSVQATTHPVAPLVIVNGPIARELGFNSGYNVFGQGFRANMTIGRAVRLLLMNVGGGLPGTGDRSTQGSPAKIAYCVAENEAANPWEPLHVEHGFPVDVEHRHRDRLSRARHNIQITTATRAWASSRSSPARWARPQQQPPRLRPPAAVTRARARGPIARDGYNPSARSRSSSSSTRAFRWPSAKSTGACTSTSGTRWDSPDTLLPIVRSPDDILVIVRRRGGKHSCWQPTSAIRLRRRGAPSRARTGRPCGASPDLTR